MTDPNALLDQAKAIVHAMRLGARRAFVMELTGTPKAGKTTTLAMLQGFFKAAGFRVETLKERAGDCPLSMKGHFFFNAWTFGTMLAEVLEAIERSVDLLILDRGFFDALIWLELQRARHQVTDAEERVFADFVTLQRWRSLVDYTVVMRVDPEKALVRENINQLIPRTGSLMNTAALAAFNDAVDRAKAKYGGKFRLDFIDTSSTQDTRGSTIALLERALPVMQSWANPDIAVVDKATVAELFGSRAYIDLTDAGEILSKLFASARAMSRAKAEEDNSVVQLVACGVPVRGDGTALVFRREANDEKAASYGKTTLWKGCHIPATPAALTEADVEAALKARLADELHLETIMNPRFTGLAWWRADQELDAFTDPQHLGIIFRVKLEDSVAETLHQKEFRRGPRGHRFTGQFLSQEQILAELPTMELEPWSKHLIENWRIDA